ncbi:MAG: GNAT family N-acetyltransferase [Pseudomonadota bacterium]
MAEDYVIRVLNSPLDVDATAWDALRQTQPNPSPFMRHAYLAALHASGSAAPATGWTPHFITLNLNGEMVAACALYEKAHSYGEYVFDWAWANAYAQHGLPYYPKATAAVPFTPVPGARLMARDAAVRVALVQAMVHWCEDNGMSSLHLLFANEDDAQACAQAGLMLRHTVQFHWKNVAPTLATTCAALPLQGAALPESTPLLAVPPCTGRPGAAAISPEGARLAKPQVHALGRPGGETEGYSDFDAFLASLSQEKRKKIRQERRKVADAGVSFRWSMGRDIAQSDWNFFYRCYERTYLEHGNAPYLNRDFFARMADTMAEHWLLFIAERDGKPIASSLIALDAYSTRASGSDGLSDSVKVAYGRYWGALERVDCLHFEACYYQPLQWCIEHGYLRFEGGAQGEHKMARALLPVKTTSAHWLAHPAFADAVARFLEREDQGINNYLDDLGRRSPFKHDQ